MALAFGAINLAWQLDDEGIELSILLHDRDRKFAGVFDRVFGLLYVLVFVHLGTRRVLAAACTSEPNG